MINAHMTVPTRQHAIEAVARLFRDDFPCTVKIEHCIDDEWAVISVTEEYRFPPTLCYDKERKAIPDSLRFEDSTPDDYRLTSDVETFDWTALHQVRAFLDGQLDNLWIGCDRVLVCNMDGEFIDADDSSLDQNIVWSRDV
ncbi:hypothetical protein BCAL_1654 [Bifidobacterium callitrichos DSM 23973]|uniref:Uncharacterized protein n=2 Tax=Bifidobacterium callitrichos TaxID=762209 RepID=A0A087A4Z0_9BIFI|nr:hypothetical protein BCAL_1654 [Bifidobacterium callitrichos DSM 23973]